MLDIGYNPTARLVLYNERYRGQFSNICRSHSWRGAEGVRVSESSRSCVSVMGDSLAGSPGNHWQLSFKFTESKVWLSQVIKKKLMCIESSKK